MTHHHIPLVGAVLRGLSLSCALLVLSGCANGKVISNPLADILVEQVGRATGKTEEAPSAAPSNTGAPPLIVGLDGNRVAMPFDGMRGKARYYASPDGVELALVNVFVTRTAGLPNNLEGAYLPADSAYNGDFRGAAQSGATLTRLHEYFSKGEIKRDEYACTLSYEAQEGSETKGIVEERCQVWFRDHSFINRYWMDENTVVCSLQSFHPAQTPLQFFATEEQALSQNLADGGSC